MTDIIPLARPAYSPKARKQVEAILESGFLTSSGSGPYCQKLENAFFMMTGSTPVATSSGTAAIHLALSVLDLEPTDEVIVPSFTCIAAAAPILYSGAIPVFCDVDPDTLMADPESVASVVTPHTRAVIIPHYAGRVPDLQPFRDICSANGLWLIEDASHSAPVSAVNEAGVASVVGDCQLADFTTFSFQATKLVAAGEGGILLTRHSAMLDRLRQQRFHGMEIAPQQPSAVYSVPRVGFKYNLQEISCCLALDQLSNLQENLADRSRIADIYQQELRSIRSIRLPAPSDNLFSLYPIRLPDRDAVFNRLLDHGIQASIHWHTPLHQMPVFTPESTRIPLPCSEAASNSVLSLPIFPSMLSGDAERVTRQLRSIISSIEKPGSA